MDRHFVCEVQNPGGGYTAYWLATLWETIAQLNAHGGAGEIYLWVDAGAAGVEVTGLALAAQAQADELQIAVPPLKRTHPGEY